MYPCRKCWELASSSQSSSNTFVDLSMSPTSDEVMMSPPVLSRKRKQPEIILENKERAVFAFMSSNVEMICPLDEFFSSIDIEHLS